MNFPTNTNHGQGSREWRAARCGKVTASRLADVNSVLSRKTKTGNVGDAAAKQVAYRIELMSERLTGIPEEHYVSPDMERGTELEPEARKAYAKHFGVEVKQVGFVRHPKMDYFGASPDGLVGDDGGIEIKCPRRTTHIRWAMAGEIPEQHRLQMLGNLVCTGRQWWDFVSYDPDLPGNLRLFVKRMYRDESLISMVEREVERFNSELEDSLAVLIP